MRSPDEVKFAFSPVGGMSPTQTMKLMKIEAAFKECASEVLDLVPESADRTHLLRQLLSCKFWASQAISHEVAPAKKSPVTPPPSAVTKSEGSPPSAANEQGPKNG